MDARPGSAPSRQKLTGERLKAGTRQRLLDAAGTEFADRGYLAVTVGAIAERAGTTVQTLYTAWGSKRALLRAHLHDRLSEGAAYPDVLIARVRGRDPEGVLEEIAVIMSELAQRASGPWALYREASAVEPEVRQDWDDLQRRRHDTFDRLLADVPDRAWRPGLDRDRAVDTAWAIASPDTYELLKRHHRYSMNAYSSWLRRTLQAALLDATTDYPAAGPEDLAADRTVSPAGN